MIIPYQAEVPITREPKINIIILLACTAIFIYTSVSGLPPWFTLNSGSIRGAIFHIFAHSDFLHLLGNMLFLWAFGNALNSEFGDVMYSFMFMAFGLCAAIAHTTFSENPAVGSSGAISGVMTMFLVLHPKAKVRCVWIFELFNALAGRRIAITTYWLFIIWLGLDIYGGFNYENNIAYAAHFGGYISGAVTGLVLRLMAR